MAQIEMTFMSTSLMRDVSVKVFLPTDYEAMFQPQKPYKTVYFLPGFSASANSLVGYLGFRLESELKGLAIVIPNGENSFYADVPIKRSYYSTFISKELIEVTRKIFPLSDIPEDTYLAGISMGGFGTLYNGLMHPETFSKIAALSPAIQLYDLPAVAGFNDQFMNQFFGSPEAYRNSDANVFEHFTKERKLPDLFLGCGRQDVLVWEQNKAFHEKLEAEGILHEWMELDGNHDIYTWQQMLDRVFSFFAGIQPGTRNKLAL